jgi:hypothetical protein
MKASILAPMALAALVACPSAFAQYYHGHRYPRASVGVYFGAPYPWYVPPPPPPVYYYPPAVVYSPPVVVREAPTVYIEQGEVVAPVAPAAPAVSEAPVRQTFEAGYWYYCPERKAYYPSVESCPGTWQKVAPTTTPKR